MSIDLRTTLRHLTMRALFFLPKERQTHIERWLRGREDFRKLGLADCVIVSFGKSGRTWLRVMLSRVYQLQHGLARRHLLAFDNLHAMAAGIPKIFFTHDNYLKDYTKQGSSKALYRDKKVILMIRDPADVAVSQYFQWKFRMAEKKRRINEYPAGNEDVELFDFVMRPSCGLPKIIDWMNAWGRELNAMKDVMVLRYEELRAQPADTLRQVLDFVGTPASADVIRQAVEFASVENMRQLERKRVFWLSGRRMLAKDPKNPNTYKVRRAKVGGYRDDFTPEQLAAIDALIEDRLMPVFAYGRAHPGENLATV
jgi:hypothetical protein